MSRLSPILLLLVFAAVAVIDIESSTTSWTWSFKDKHCLAYRKRMSAKIRAKYPTRIPIIVQNGPSSSLQDIDKGKFLVPYDLTVAQFMYVIRKRIQLSPGTAMFLFVNKVLPTTSADIGSIYDEHKDEDGFLYTAYSDKSTY